MITYLGINLYLSSNYAVCNRSILFQNEFWKDVVGYEGSYIISSLGRVKSLTRVTIKANGRKQPVKGGIVSGTLTHYGYIQVPLYKNLSKRIFRKSRLVAEAFITNTENKPQTNHKNKIKIHNSISNLEWCTPQENIIHAWRNGKRSYIKTENNKYNASKECLDLETGFVYRDLKLACKETNNNYNTHRSKRNKKIRFITI